MQTNTKPQTASPMVGLDEAHQLEVQIMNLKNLGYTMVRSAIPPLKLQEIQTAFEQKMSEQIATMGRGHRNAFNRFDLIPLWQEPVFRQLVHQHAKQTCPGLCRLCAATWSVTGTMSRWSSALVMDTACLSAARPIKLGTTMRA